MAAGSGIQRNAFLSVQISHSPQDISFSVLLKCIMHLEGNFAPEFCCCNLQKGANCVKKVTMKSDLIHKFTFQNYYVY